MEDNMIKQQILNETQTRGEILIKEDCLKSNFESIREFHQKYNLQPTQNNKELQEARIKHMTEELNEYIKAQKEGNREQQLDALVDLVYVTLGTAYYENFDFDGAFKHIHSCNMKKIQKATKRSKWDVVKPEGWQPQNFKDYI